MRPAYIIALLRASFFLPTLLCATSLRHRAMRNNASDPAANDGTSLPDEPGPALGTEAWSQVYEYAQSVLQRLRLENTPSPGQADNGSENGEASDTETLVVGDFVDEEQLGGHSEENDANESGYFEADAAGALAVSYDESVVSAENGETKSSPGLPGGFSQASDTNNGQSDAPHGTDSTAPKLPIPPIFVIDFDSDSDPSSSGLPRHVYDQILKYVRDTSSSRSDTASAPPSPECSSPRSALDASSSSEAEPPSYQHVSYRTRVQDVADLQVPPKRTRVRTVTVPSQVEGYEAVFRSMTTAYPDGAWRRERTVRANAGPGADPEKLKRYIADLRFNPWCEDKTWE